MNSVRTLVDRFWVKVAIGEPDACWPWQGQCDKDGYGRFETGGHRIQAHRISALLSAMPIDEKICHRCDYTSCVNPAHLWPGTQAQNMADMAAKGRARNGTTGKRHDRGE